MKCSRCQTNVEYWVNVEEFDSRTPETRGKFCPECTADLLESVAGRSGVRPYMYVPRGSLERLREQNAKKETSK